MHWVLLGFNSLPRASPSGDKIVPVQAELRPWHLRRPPVSTLLQSKLSAPAPWTGFGV